MSNMHHRLISSFLLLFVVYCKARDGPCPVIPPVENLNFAQLAQGRWYHLYHNYNDELHFFDKLKCIEKYINYDADVGAITMDSYGVCEVTGKPKWSKCYGYATDTPGVFKMVLANASLPYDSLEFRIIDTDYTSFSIGYVCAYNQKTNSHFVNAGICSRSQRLTTGNKLLSAFKLFKTYGVNINFVPTDWTDCRARCET